MIQKKTLIIVAAVLIAIFAITTTSLALDWGPIQKVGWGNDWDIYPNAAAGSNGKLYVVWTTYPDDRTTFFNSYDGTHWGTAQRISGRIPYSFWTDLFVDSSENVHVVWEGSGYMYYVKFNGSSWSYPTLVYQGGSDPDIVVLDTGEVIIANRGMSGIFSIIGDGVTWSAPINTGEHSWLDLSKDNNGVVYLAYSDYATQGKIAFRTWTGSTWSDETLLDGYCSYLKMFHGPDETADILCLDGDINQWHYDGSSWNGPTLVASAGNGWKNASGSPNGVVMVAWTQPISENAGKEDVFVRIWTGSKWLDVENVSNTEWRSIWPAVGITSDNKVFTIWSENDYHGWAWTLKARESQFTLNDPPTVDAGGPYIVEEGSSVILTATGTDPEGQPLTYAWDLDNNGTFETPGQSVSFASLDGPANHMVSVQVTDNGGLAASAQTTVHVNNVPPKASFNATASVSEGSIFVLTLTNPVDVAADLVSLQYAFDCGSGYGAFGTSTNVSCPVADNGTLNVSGQVRDKDGGVSEYTATVTVNNVAPTVSTPVVTPEPSTEGSSVTASATFTDPVGSLDAPFTCTVNYGDGSGDLAGTISGDTCTGPGYSYPTFGIYTVIVNVTDKDEGTGSNSTTHSVIFNWTGFFPPVDNPPVLNGVKSGSAVPIKFSLGGNKGLNIFASGYPQSIQVACDTGAAMDDIDTTETAGNSSLSYDPVTEVYNYVWKTEKAWVGTCRQLVVKLIDGTEHNTIFKFK